MTNPMVIDQLFEIAQSWMALDPRAARFVAIIPLAAFAKLQDEVSTLNAMGGNITTVGGQIRLLLEGEGTEIWVIDNERHEFVVKAYDLKWVLIE